MEKHFPSGPPVLGDDLIGRETEIRQLLSTLTNGQSVLLIAPRRFGKTSLALEVFRRLKKTYYTADVDIFRIISKKEFAEKLVDSALENKKISGIMSKIKKGLGAVIKNMQFKQVIEDYEFVLDFASDAADENRLFENAFDFLDNFAAKNKKHMFVFLDEFGDVTKLDGGEILKKMRAIIQRQQHVTYLFAGSQESIMKNIFAAKKSPFFRFAMSFEIGNLPESDTSKYIKREFTSLGFVISNETIKEITELTDCHPYYTQLLCQKIYIDVKGEKKLIGSVDVKNALESALLAERQYFEEMWERLREKKNHALIAKKIAEGISPYEILSMDRQLIYHHLRSLEKMGIIKKIKKGYYKIIDPFFRGFINP